MIVALVAVVVVVGSVILWSFFGDVLSKRSHKAAGRCVGGQETVAVVADPSIATSVQELAESYNKSAGPIGDRCMVVNVKPADSDAVLNGFIGKWPAELGGQPALWIPGSSISAARLAEPRLRRRSARAIHWSAPRWCLPCVPNWHRPSPSRTGRRCPGCRPTRMRWRG